MGQEEDFLSVRGFKPCVWVPSQRKGWTQNREGFLDLTWPLPSPGATVVTAVFSPPATSPSSGPSPAHRELAIWLELQLSL